LTRKHDLPPLVTAGSVTNPVPGAIGQPNTTVLFSGTDGDKNVHDGARVSFGYGIDTNPDWAADGSFFFLGQIAGSRTFTGTGARGTPVLGRPFFSLNARAEANQAVAAPNIAAGSIAITTPRDLYGGDIDLRSISSSDANNRFTLLFGGRFLQLEEGLHMVSMSSPLLAQGVLGNTFSITEQFDTQNRFYGGQVGAEYEYRLGPVSLAATAKLALGAMQENLNDTASSRIIQPNGITLNNFNRGLYISPGNAGKFNRTQFAFVPEGNFKLALDLNQYVRVTVGYTLLYLSDVIRPGDQLNRNVNLGPVAAPPPSFKSTEFWAQGLDLGVRFSF
jgi:hypothetical protein